MAENLREAIRALTVTGIDREITASFGVAVLPDDAPEAQALLRSPTGRSTRRRPTGATA